MNNILYKTYYNSPIGKIILVSKNNALIGLWFENQKYYLNNINEELVLNDNEPILIKAKNWLDRYFNNEKPSISELNISPNGTPFAKQVWSLLIDIPYGKTTTYKELSFKIAKILNKKNMSPQAIGNAASRNPLSIIIPCHRLICTNNDLGGYAGGLSKKIFLLKHEQNNKDKLSHL